jgi:Spy/CpxP family protein refolding chaperone
MKYLPALLVSLIVASAVIAAPPQRPPRRDALPPRVLADFLDLTSAQQDQVKTFHERLRTTLEPLRVQRREAREKIRTAVDAGNAEQAGELMIAGKELRQQFKAAHDTFKTSFASILTPAQKAKWEVYQELREARREARRR